MDGSTPLTPALGAPPMGGSMPPAPMAPAPAPMLPWQPGKTRPISEEAFGKWKTRTDRAQTFAEQFYPQWDRALERYSKAKYEKERYDVNALKDYAHVEGKKAQLFHRTPEVQLHPIDPSDPAIPWDQIVPLRQKYLNYKLGPRGANAKAALHKTIVDALAASGWLICKVGYENITLPVPGMMNPDGSAMSVPVYERCFISRVSPKKLLVPDDFHDTDFDAAPWLGEKFRMPLSVAKKQPGWTIPDDFQGSTSGDDDRFLHGMEQGESVDPMVEGIAIWYKAHLFDADVFNPELYRELVMLTGLEKPVKCADSPYQSIDDRGRLTDDSMVGNPIHVGTLRDLPDSAYVPCDLVVGEQLTREINKFRTQVIRGRSRRQPIVLFDTLNLDQNTIDKIEKNDGPVGMPAGSMAGGVDKIIAVVQTGSEPRDNFTAQQMAERDWEQALGSSANQSGQFASSKRTATEVRNVQSNASARNKTEEDRIREYFVALVRKFDALEQRFATQDELQKVLGQQGAALWKQWKALPGTYGYDILPDAGQHIDAAQNRAQTLDEYNLLRKDARVNTDELLRKVARALGYDPVKFVAPPQEPKPEPVKLAYSMSGQDVQIEANARLLLDLLKASGIQLSPETIAALAQSAVDARPSIDPVTGLPLEPHGMPPHGGSADRTEPLNQHARERTGGITGVGAAA